jgi:uncharacterized protein YndB with AHSA1/START domain
MDTNTTQLCYHINAPRDKVYSALINETDIQKWRVPNKMTSQIHYFNGSEGGEFRISLTYTSKKNKGKSIENTDTYHGSFVKLIQNKKVVEVDEFETKDPNLKGKMTISISLFDRNSGTDILAIHEGLPSGVSSSDNELGWNESFKKLANLVESR